MANFFAAFDALGQLTESERANIQLVRKSVLEARNDSEVQAQWNALCAAGFKDTFEELVNRTPEQTKAVLDMLGYDTTNPPRA